MELKDKNCTKEEYYKYLRVRDNYGDSKGTKDLLDFPVIQKEELPEYTVFLDMLEENYKGRTFLALQEYREGIVSPMGQPLREYRSLQFKNTSSVEDFINPLDEPSHILSYNYKAKHVFVYKEDNELRLIRISGNNAEGDVVVRETLYDITDVPVKDMKVFEESVSKDYLDKETFDRARDMLCRNGCSLGDKVAELYADRTRKVIGISGLKDAYLPKGYEGSMQKMDLVFASSVTGDMDAAKRAFADAVNRPVAVYAETEYWHHIVKEGEKDAYIPLGSDIQVFQYDNFSRSAKAFWNAGDEMALGVKCGDIAARGQSVNAKYSKTFPDGTEVRLEKVTVARVLPLGKSSAIKAEELMASARFSMPNRFLQDLRTLDGIDSRAKLESQARAAAPFIEAQKQAVRLMRNRVNELFPQKKKTFVRELLSSYVKEWKVLVDKKTLDLLDKIDFRKEGTGQAKSEKDAQQIKNKTSLMQR